MYICTRRSKSSHHSHSSICCSNAQVCGCLWHHDNPFPHLPLITFACCTAHVCPKTLVLFSLVPQTVGVDRQGLTAFLVDEAARRFPDAIDFHFDVKPDLDLQQRRVRFVSRESNQRTGSPMELPYDLLVGADGAGSSVRAALELTVPDVTVRAGLIAQILILDPVIPDRLPLALFGCCSKRHQQQAAAMVADALLAAAVATVCCDVASMITESTCCSFKVPQLFLHMSSTRIDPIKCIERSNSLHWVVDNRREAPPPCCR